jgi:glutamate racemase
VGGLGVLAALARVAPGASTLYIADQAHVPYGGRPLDEIHAFARALTAHAFDAGARMVIMACNVSSATYAAEAARERGADRVLGVVDPGAAAAARATVSGRVGVLATEGTVVSEAYPLALERLRPALRVTQVACPRFVPLVEAGHTAGEEAEDAAREALAPLRRADVDTVVLGCTHYPFLLPALRAVAPDLTFVDPATWTARAAATCLGLANTASAGGRAVHRLVTTGDPRAFDEQARAFLPDLDFEPATALRWAAPRVAS